eukprot:16382_1
MSVDPVDNNNSNNNNGAIVRYKTDDDGNPIIAAQQAIDSNNKNVNKSLTGWSGYGATPNVNATINTKGTQKLNVNSNDKIDFEQELGPVVLNHDGTISRIKNWSKLTAIEQEKVRSKIMKRNAKRRYLLQQKENKTNQQNENENDKND